MSTHSDDFRATNRSIATRHTLRCDELTFGDPYEYQQAVLGATNEMVITQSGGFAANLIRIELHQLRIHRGHERLARVSHSAIDHRQNPVGFPTDLQQAPRYHSGTEVSPGQIVFYAPGSEYHQRTTRDTRWGSLELSAKDLAVASKVLAGIEVEPPAADRVMRPSLAAISRLLNLHKAAGDLATTAPDVLTHPEVARTIEQELVRAMVHCLAGDTEVVEGPPGKRRASVMRGFERAIAEAGTEPLYLAEVCAAAGVTGRTLRNHCVENLGISPQRYLWLRRMHLARRALALADGRTATVTTIANDHGFAELGRFAVTYRQLFGESPSVTLSRAPDLPRPLSEMTWSAHVPRPGKGTPLPFLLSPDPA